jgi:hypothetical protein
MTAAERDQGVTEPGDCWICDAKPEPCEEHPTSPIGPRGCTVCNRRAFAEWLARVGAQRICDGSGERCLACPGCAACCTAETSCPAFALPDESWAPAALREAPCVFCGEGPARHRQMPPLPDEPSRPGGILGFKVIDADGADLGTVGDILRDPR